MISVLVQRFPEVRFQADTPDSGLIDSQAILDVLLEVEEQANVVFGGNFDFGGPITPLKLAKAFKSA